MSARAMEGLKMQRWIFSVSIPTGKRPQLRRIAVVGPASASTVEAALHLAGLAEPVRAEIRGDGVVRSFVEGRLDPAARGYYAHHSSIRDDGASWWCVCIGSVQEVLVP